MVEITFEGDRVIFEMRGWDKLWSLRSRLEIPRDHIIDAHLDREPAMGWFEGLKIAGTDIPNIFRAGTFYQQGEWVFWDVHHPEKTIVVELEHEKFRKLIIEVEDPEQEVQRIKSASKNL
ncbi:MAG TPA: hypothetical protein VGN86_13415 [Pyrinomonadaceae bacterium]|nr:hypothetical protein [Pyrinomonadaceae bacterium]